VADVVVRGNTAESHSGAVVAGGMVSIRRENAAAECR